MMRDISKRFVEIDGHFEAEQKHEKPIQVLFCISYNKAANWF